MASETNPPTPHVPPPKRDGSGRLLPTAERGNATTEELSWPIVTSAQLGKSMLVEGPAERGNATVEELTWPVMPDAGEIPALGSAQHLVTEPHRGQEFIRDRWTWPIKLAFQLAPQPQPTSDDYEVIAPYQSPTEEAETAGTRAVELRRSTSHVWTLWVRLTGAVAEGRLARFTIEAPLGGNPWKIICFVGTDEGGVGELSLSRFDPRRVWKLAPGCTFVLESPVLHDLQPDDRKLLEESRDAAIRGRDTLESILKGMTKNTPGE